MNEQRQQAYTTLIDKFLATSQPEEVEALLWQHEDLIDAGLIERIKLAAVDFNERQSDRGEKLRSLTQYLTEYIETTQPTQADFEFLSEVLSLITDGKQREQIYSLFHQNLDKINLRLANALQLWVYDNLLNLELEQQKARSYIIGNFSLYIKEFSSGKRADNIEIAITGYKILLTICDFPVDWAKTQYNLGNAYWNRIKGDKAENIELAIEYCQNALIVFNQQYFPVYWAGTQNHLGAAYSDRIKGDKAENIEQAIEFSQNALFVFNQQNFPEDWARTQINLGKAYLDRIKGDKIENIERAIEFGQNALIVFNQQNFPVYWANIQSNLVAAYNNRIKGDKAENIERAIEYCQNALIIRTQQDFPEDWARTQINLGKAYTNRIKGDKAENIELAISAFQNALCVFIKQGSLYEHALYHINLGDAYQARIKGDRGENIELAISAFQNVLCALTQQNSPFVWANTQVCLGNAYKERTKGGRAENIKRAIFAFQNALLVLTQQVFPYECFLTARNLGSLYFAEGNWQLTVDVYTTAVEAIEQLREWASNDYNKQEIFSRGIEVYQNIVQAYINLGQLNKAIEYVERSKARNLVDLLSTRDLYPKGNIPQQVIAQLDDLRKNAIAEEIRLRQQGNLSNSRNNSSSTENNRDLAAYRISECNTAIDRTHLNNLRQQLEQLIAEEIQPIDPAFQLTQRVEPIKFEQIQATLPNKQTALIEWFIGDGTLSAFIVTRQQATPLHLNYSESQFSNLLETADRYYISYRQRDGQWHNNLPNLLTQLAQNLQTENIIEQIKTIVPDCNQIILVPHRWLHLLPIHAVPLDDGKCLLDLFDYGVSYAPSVQLLEFTQKQAGKNQEIKQEQSFFAVQNPTEDLEYTDIEVKTIRSQFTPNDEVLKTKEATKSALTKERLSKANLSHFSCHGSFNFENPELSALHLASSKIEEKTKQDLVATAEKTRFLPDRDGSYIDLEQCLTLGEIFGLDLRNCCLVTLSACETGLTDFKSLSDEYIGLPSGFLFAGSPSVVSSLWAVNDLSTSFLMIKFYQNLQQMNSVPIALNQAQLWLRSLTRKEFIQWSKNLPLRGMQRAKFEAKFVNNEHPFASPYHWAAFCAVGS
ncbi:MAG: CHAT domain-containing protein [Cyanobacteria bacterium P01_A01_bin.84]